MGILKNLFVFSILMVAAVNCVGAGGIGDLGEKVNEVIDAVEKIGKDYVQCVENCGFNTECKAACASGASSLKVSGIMTTIMIVLSTLAAYIWK
jgi:hypothetical protein